MPREKRDKPAEIGCLKGWIHMKIKPEFTVRFDEDDICIVRLRPDGTEEFVSPLSASAAMAWEAIERGLGRDAIIDMVANEFDGASRDLVAADLDALMTQLIALGYAE